MNEILIPWNQFQFIIINHIYPAISEKANSLSMRGNRPRGLRTVKPPTSHIRLSVYSVLINRLPKTNIWSPRTLCATKKAKSRNPSEGYSDLGIPAINPRHICYADQRKKHPDKKTRKSFESRGESGKGRQVSIREISPLIPREVGRGKQYVSNVEWKLLNST